MVATRLQDMLGQGVTGENKAGGGGVIATDFVAKAQPDGYTLLMPSTGPHTVMPTMMPTMMPKIPYDSVKDLIPISNVASTTHMSGALFKSMAGGNLIHVPFKGGAPLAVVSIAGDVPISFNNMFDALPHIRSGKLRGLAVTSAARQGDNA